MASVDILTYSRTCIYKARVAKSFTAARTGALISLTIRIRPTGHGYRDIPQGYREKKVATNGEGDSPLRLTRRAYSTNLPPRSVETVNPRKYLFTGTFYQGA